MHNIVCICYSMQHAVLLVWRALQECFSTCIEPITIYCNAFHLNKIALQRAL
jgi:galactose mutarotase-like enzyme